MSKFFADTRLFLYKNITKKMNIKDLIKEIIPIHYHSSIYFIYTILSNKKLSFRKRLNYLKISYSLRRGESISRGLPVLLGIEPTNVCNLNCPICETGSGVLERKKKFMTFDEFKYILDQFDDNLDQLNFYFMGEPFLNKDAYRMINYASSRKISVTSCTNGEYVIPEELVESGIREIDFQIAGMTQKSHEFYRINANLGKTLLNLEKTIELRNKLSSANKMKIVIGFILMKHNEHEVDNFIAYCKSIGVDHYNIIGTCLRNVDQGEIYLPTDRSYWYYDEEKYKKGKLVPKKRPDNICGWIYSTTTIMANGDVVACCRDAKGNYIFGNVFEENFYNIWNNEKYQRLRKIVSENSNEFPLCELCSAYNIPVIK